MNRHMWSTVTIQLVPGLNAIQSMTAAIEQHCRAMGLPMCRLPFRL